MKSLKQHTVEVENISKQIKIYTQSNSTKKLRFYHGGTNSTRQQNMEDYYLIDISHLDDIIEVNTERKYILVEPNVSMDKLVNTTLQYGFVPPVVMEFPGITVGGAVNGGTLESSSFRYGQLSDTTLEYEIILGNGELLHASPDNHVDVFYGISGTYGTIGLVTLIKLQLIPAASYVHTIYYPTTTPENNLALLKEQIQNKDNDYVEGIIFDKNYSVVITGKLTENKTLSVATYTKASDPWFYEQPKKVATNNMKREELIPIRDYLFRYNRGAFWTGELAFPILHVPNNKLTKFLLNPFFNTRKMYDSLHALNISQTFFLQDFYCPIENVLKFVDYSDKQLGIYPIWLCPIKPTRNSQKLSPHYIDTTMLIDIGIWGQYKENFSDPAGINRAFEDFANKTHSRKMFYAHSYYTEDEFWAIYDKNWYSLLRRKYHAENTFPEIWQKVHVSGKYKQHFWQGVLKVFLDTLKGKHLNT